MNQMKILYKKHSLIAFFILFNFTYLFSQNICVDYSSISTKKNKNGVEYGVANINKTWNTGKVITVGFLNGSSELNNLVLSYASEWSKYGNINFQLGNYYNSDIRIEYNQSGFNYSFVGTDAKTERRNSHTMALSYTKNTYGFKSTVLHEFGHALGLLHEHKHSEAPFTWNESKVYAYYQQIAGWSKAKTYRNVIERYGKGSNFTNHRNGSYDKYSIMHYQVPAKLTLENISVGNNYDLSNGDKKLIAELYPGRYIEPIEKDSDGDGVLDNQDKCPYTYGPSYNRGCPVKKTITKEIRDRDRDGVPDDKDLCPYKYGDKYYNGCPSFRVRLSLSIGISYGNVSDFKIENNFLARNTSFYRNHLNAQIGLGLYLDLPAYGKSKSPFNPYIILNGLALKQVRFDHQESNTGHGFVNTLGANPELGFRIFTDNSNTFYFNLSASYFIPYSKNIVYWSEDTELTDGWNKIDESQIDTKGFSFSAGIGFDTNLSGAFQLEYNHDIAPYFQPVEISGIESSTIGTLKLSYIYIFD